MEFLKKFRTRVGNYLLGKEVTKARHQRYIISMKEAKTIGLVFGSENAEDVELAKKYENYLKEMGKSVKAIGFINAREIDPNSVKWAGPLYITRKELSWFYRPSEEFIANFVKEPFDMLIDMNIEGKIPLLFVSASSKAKCKVGRYDEKYLGIYDVMIEADETKTLKYYLKNVDTYMDMLDKGNHVNAAK